MPEIKRSRFLCLLGVMVLMLVSASANTNAQMKGYNPADAADMRAQSVSLIQLIANPERYDGKHVRVIGFLRLEFEGDALYLHREDYDRSLTNNGIWIDRPHDLSKSQDEAINLKYVICEGVFRANNHGHMGLFSGTLSQINRLQMWTLAEDRK